MYNRTTNRRHVLDLRVKRWEVRDGETHAFRKSGDSDRVHGAGDPGRRGLGGGHRGGVTGSQALPWLLPVQLLLYPQLQHERRLRRRSVRSFDQLLLSFRSGRARAPQERKSWLAHHELRTSCESPIAVRVKRQRVAPAILSIHETPRGPHARKPRGPGGRGRRARRSSSVGCASLRPAAQRRSGEII